MLARRGWSLLEILVVVAIIAVLGSVAAPAIQGIMQSTARQAAVDNVMAILDQARTLAVSQNRAAYVAFADETTDDAYRCRAMCIYLDDEDLTKISPVAQTGWLQLPSGICFRNDIPSLVNAPITEQSPLFVPPGAVAGKPFHYIKFNRTGAVEFPADTNALRLILSAGLITSSGKYISLAKAQAKAPLEQISIAHFSGRPKYQLVPQGGAGS